MIEWFIALGIGLAVSMAIYFVAFSIMVMITKRKGSEANVALVNPWMSSIIVSPIVLLLSLAAIFMFGSTQLNLWGFQLVPYETLSLLSIVGLTIAAITVGLSERLSPTPQKMNPPSATRERIVFFFVIVILASVSEEVLFRGFFQSILDRTLLLSIDFGLFSLTAGALVSALLFSLVHIAPAKQMGGSIFVLMGSAFILGLVAGIFLTYSGSLLPSIILHVEFNLIGFALGIRKLKE